MTIIYAGAYEHEAVLSRVSTDVTKYDENYAPYALHLFPNTGSQSLSNPPAVWLAYSPVPIPAPTYVNWIHFKCVRQGAMSGTAAPAVIMQVFGAGGNLLFHIIRETNHSGGWGLRVNGSTSGGSSLLPNVDGFFPIGDLVTYDFKITQDGVNHLLEFYVNGILQGTASRANAAQNQLDVVRFTAIPTTAQNFDLFISEMIMTDNESTIGARLSSSRPVDPAVLNTWSGLWESLGDNDSGSGISTDIDGARIAGAFEVYNGTPSPVGIRAVVQANYYVDNNSGLEISSFLRSGSTNNDVYTFQAADVSRVFTVWDENPFSATFWAVADLASVRGGIRTSPV